MSTIDTLMANVQDAFERILKLLCSDAFSVNPSVTDSGGTSAVGLIVSVSSHDEATIKAQGAESALVDLAAAIGIHAGTAVSFQFE